MLYIQSIHILTGGLKITIINKFLMELIVEFMPKKNKTLSQMFDLHFLIFLLLLMLRDGLSRH